MTVNEKGVKQRMVDVLILMGSESDRQFMDATADTLARLGISHRLEVSSAHRQPRRTRELVEEATAEGTKVFICGAGMAAHLAGVVASLTDRPVVGVPLPGSELGGLDSLLSTAQMPRGVPVATVAIGKHGAVNAAILAAQILALSDENLRERLRELRRETPAPPV
jgi:phosphoribosylaminoimidazole carboxylase PurE protein